MFQQRAFSCLIYTLSAGPSRTNFTFSPLPLARALLDLPPQTRPGAPAPWSSVSSSVKWGAVPQHKHQTLGRNWAWVTIPPSRLPSRGPIIPLPCSLLARLPHTRLWDKSVRMPLIASHSPETPLMPGNEGGEEGVCNERRLGAWSSSLGLRFRDGVG